MVAELQERVPTPRKNDSINLTQQLMMSFSKVGCLGSNAMYTYEVAIYAKRHVYESKISICQFCDLLKRKPTSMRQVCLFIAEI